MRSDAPFNEPKPIPVATALRWRYRSGDAGCYCQADRTIWLFPNELHGCFRLGYVPRGDELSMWGEDWRLPKVPAIERSERP